MADEITLAADQWCPFNCIPGDKNPGLMVEIAQEALQAKGHKLIYQNINWSRALEMTAAGKINGVFGAYVADAPDLIYPKNEQVKVKTCFFAKTNSNLLLKKVNDLKGKKVGTAKDYTYGDELEKFRKTKDANGVFEDATGDDPLTMNIKKVIAGRLDFLLENDSIVNYNVEGNKEFANSLKKSLCLAPIKSYVAFSPKNPNSKEYAKIISDYMITAKKNGRLKEIFAKYHVSQ
jgi:polar amino acid transport system substrate-binding protein